MKTLAPGSTDLLVADPIDPMLEDRQIHAEAQTMQDRARRPPIAIAGRVLIAIGGLLLLFLLFEFAFSDLSAARSQALLLERFKGLVTTGAATAPGWAPAVGSPVALLDIPKLGIVQMVVVQGTTPALLKQGPGHFRNTALPGDIGNVVIAGRRTTYGAPFGGIDQLVKGNTIVVISPQGTFSYAVQGKKVVLPGQQDVLGSTDDPTLTLVTSSPALGARGRLAVVAKLKGDALPTVRRAPAPIGAEETGLGGDTGALGPVLLWGEILAMVLVAAWWLRRRGFNQRVVYLLSAPMVITLMFLLFENLDRLLPGTL